MNAFSNFPIRPLFMLLMLVLAACSSGGNDQPADDDSGDTGNPPPGAYLFVDTSGLEGSGLLLENTITNASAADPAAYPIVDTLPINHDGAAYFGRTLQSGESYSVKIKTQPSDPAQICLLDGGVGTVLTGPLAAVEIRCSNATVGGTVTDTLLGSGLQLALSREVELNGNVSLLEIEQLPIDASGDFEFNTRLIVGEQYKVRISAQPVAPEQECTIENATGTISGSVTDIVVACPGPLRVWRYDDNSTRFNDDPDYDFGFSPLEAGRQVFGSVYDEYKYADGPSFPFGAITTLGSAPFIQMFVDRPGADGAIYSNKSGFTYWIATESPPVAFAAGTAYRHHTTLLTEWHYRKESEDSRFILEISKAHFMAYDDLHDRFEGSSMYAGANILFSAHRVVATVGGTGERTVMYQQEPFYSASGIAKLRGRVDPDDSTGATTLWTQEVSVTNDIDQEIWTEADFTLDPAAAVGLSDPRHAAISTLNNSIFVAIDLSDIAVGEEVLIISRAEVVAHNFFSIEGGTAAFFRDPVTADSSDSAGGGFALVDSTGLVMLEIDDSAPDEFSQGGLPMPQQCDPNTTDHSVLEFDAPSYQVEEVRDGPLYVPDIRVLRNGSVAGLVTAQISLSGITATAAADFNDQEIDVRFGSLSNMPRSLEHFVFDDALEEGAETLTLTLHSPQGCATIGAQNTATVTILANDPSPGKIQFVADTYEVSEPAGTASIVVERVGGTFGFVSATIATADGTAVASIDYQAVTEQINFQDGEGGQKTVLVPILDNAVVDPDRTVLLSLQASDPVMLGTPVSATLTILNDDLPDASALQFGAASYSVAEDAGFVTVTVVREGSANGDVGVTFATSDGAALAGEDYSTVQTVVSFADGDSAAKLVDVPIVDDTDMEGDHAFNVMLFDPTGGATLGEPSVIPVVIIDNDGAPPQLPAAPVLGVNAEPKQFVFDWQSVADASFYRLLQNPDGVSGFSQVGNDIALGELLYYLPFSVHLVDWNNAQFLLQACNSSGCTDSNVVNVNALMLAAIGYFKASNTDGRSDNPIRNGDAFGYATALSDDGHTLAVSALQEDSGAQFINGDQASNTATDSGAVYVFHETSTGWAQQAYIKASNTGALDLFGTALAISADGNTLVVGAPGEDSAADGINGDSADNSASRAGAVYVYSRSGNVWSLQAYVKATHSDAQDSFGTSVALTADGNTFIVGAPHESSGALGVGGDQTDNSLAQAGAAYVYTRSGSTWLQSAYLKASNTEAADWFGTVVAVSGDGSTIAITARSEDSAATGINGNQADNSASGIGSILVGTGAVYVFSNDSGAWLQQAYVKPSNTNADDLFGDSLAFSQDGSILAIGARTENGAGTGVNSTMESDNSLENAGAAYLFSRTGGIWRQDAYVKASNTGSVNNFGASIDVSADGQYVVIGAPAEDSDSVGINGDQTQHFNVDVGAAYLFFRDPITGSWAQTAFIKASNSDQDAYGYGREISFGNSVSLSGDGTVLAIGGFRDGSDATGINGDQVNENGWQSGAAYVY